VSQQGILIIDIETNNKPYYGALASPRHPDNYVVMNGHAYDYTPFSGAVVHEHYTKDNKPKDWLHIPDDCWLIVAHNAAYEMDWFLFQQRPEIMKFLKRGGRIWCTAYAEYLLSHQQDTYPTLNDTAPKYGGTEKVDGIKLLWEAGVLTEDIDPALLREYLVGPNGDIENTRKIFYGQYTKMCNNGMLAMFFERMEGLMCNTLAMDAGLFIDVAVAEQQRAAGEARIAALASSFVHWTSHIPAEVKFNLGSDMHASAWLFGGPIKYTGRELATTAEGVQKFVKGDFVRCEKDDLLLEVVDGRIKGTRESPSGYDFDVPLVKYKAGKNKGQIKIERLDTEVPLMRQCDAYINLLPLVDLNRLPKDIYKSFAKEFTGKRYLSDNSPVYSSSADCYEKLALRNEFEPHIKQILTDLLEWAKLDKDMGTYYLRDKLDDNGAVIKRSGMLQYVTPEHYIYHTLNTTSTVTTRLSSVKPNLQNLPRGDTSDVKNMFVSRFGANGYIVEADYKALEVVSLAAFTKDPALVKYLLAGTDMHCLRLAASRMELYEDVLRICKDQNDPQHGLYSLMRTNIKPKAFQYQYGATARGIAYSTGCTVEEAQLFIDTEKALFPVVEQWYDTIVTPAVYKNTTTQKEVMDGGSWRTYGRGHWESPGKTCYSFRQQEKATWDKGVKTVRMQYKATEIRNYPIQGESGFFVQCMAGKVARFLIANDFFPDENGNPRVYFINQVHDAFYLDCHKDVLDVVAHNVKIIMESLPEHLKTLGYDLGVPFPAEVEFGRSMGEKIHWHPGVLQEADTIERLSHPQGWKKPKA
jgi:hypothetical protein